MNSLSSVNLDQSMIALLRSPRTIRHRCQQLLAGAIADQLNYFACDLTQLDSVADYVIQVTQAAYPDGQIPFHSRWRHFEVGQRARVKALEQSLAGRSALEIAQAKFDLVVPSVLLDAGAGDRWHYLEPITQQQWQRSEGLAVASFDLFCQGTFSSQPDRPYQTDAPGLQALTVEALAKGLQVSATNPLVGLTGRWHLLQTLGQTLHHHPDLFGSDHPRPGNLVNYFVHQAGNGKLAAEQILQTILVGLGDIWPGGKVLDGVNLGDVGEHSTLTGAGPGDHLVPFHKLSQWLTYSLLEPLQELGLEITGLDQLTGLAEYRNGGLCLDLGLLRVKDSNLLTTPQLPTAEAIVEWRALTIGLLDQIAIAIRRKLNRTEADLPLVKILQGGTWAAGRQIADQLRPGGLPPISIRSDGTVF